MAVQRKNGNGLGLHVAALRRRNGWTLAEVGRMTGLAVSTLSKVENGQISLTYDNIVKLSEGLGVDVSELFSPKKTRSVGGRRLITRRSDERTLETEKYIYRYHATDLRDAAMVPIVVELKAGNSKEFGALMTHSGEEFIFVLEGEVEVFTEFYEPVSLKIGESIYLDSTMGHGYVRAGTAPARILGVCSSPSASFRERDKERLDSHKK